MQMVNLVAAHLCVRKDMPTAQGAVVKTSRLHQEERDAQAEAIEVGTRRHGDENSQRNRTRRLADRDRM